MVYVSRIHCTPPLTSYVYNGLIIQPGSRASSQRFRLS